MTDRDAAPAAAEGAEYERGYEQALVDAGEEALRLARARMMPAVGLVMENLRVARPAPAAAPREGAHQDAQEGQQTPSPAGVASVPTVGAADVLARHTLRRATDSPIWDVDRCEECIRPWRGDAETGGCTAVLLARRVARLEGLLREAVEGLSFCPLCGDGDPNHLPDCRYVAALADGG